MAGHAYFRNGLPVLENTPVRVNSMKELRSGNGRGTVVVVDADGLSEMRFNDRLLKSCKVRGNNLLYMGCIKHTEDVLDHFMADIDGLLFPLHMLDSYSVLDGILRLSEDCIPAVFCTGGKTAASKNASTDIPNTVRMLRNRGFEKIAVLDTDGSLDENTWNALAYSGTEILPYIPGRKEGEGLIDLL